jgi:hypothetical protein
MKGNIREIIGLWLINFVVMVIGGLFLLTAIITAIFSGGGLGIGTLSVTQLLIGFGILFLSPIITIILIKSFFRKLIHNTSSSIRLFFMLIIGGTVAGIVTRILSALLSFIPSYQIIVFIVGLIVNFKTMQMVQLRRV